jgi:mannose-6-phosphate isomerase-like protein (cupin superfamily)
MADPLYVKSGEGEQVEVAAMGIDMRVLVPGSATTDEAFCLIREETEPGGGPPLHVHHRQTELFIVQEGDYEFAAGERRFRAGPGDVVVVPPGTPHTFRNAGATRASFLFLLTPALGGDRFFREFAAMLRGEGGPPDLAALNAMAAPYALEFVGPPLGAANG